MMNITPNLNTVDTAELNTTLRPYVGKMVTVTDLVNGVSKKSYTGLLEFVALDIPEKSGVNAEIHFCFRGAPKVIPLTHRVADNNSDYYSVTVETF